MTATTVRERTLESPIELSRITGVRIHGDVDVTPVDPASLHVVTTGSQRWLVWTHGSIERALNFRHIVEVFGNEDPG